MSDFFGDGEDTTDQSILWNPGDSQGKSSSGETVPAPTEDLVENSLKGEVLDLLQGGGLDFLKSVLPDTLFVEDEPDKPVDETEDDVDDTSGSS